MPYQFLVLLLGAGALWLAAVTALRSASSRPNERLIPIPLTREHNRMTGAPKRMAMLAPGLTIGTIGAPWSRIRPLSEFWR